MRLFFLYCILFVLCNPLFAQDKIDMLAKLNAESEVIKLEKHINDLIRKDSYLSKMDNIKQYHIFDLEFQNPQKENFILYKNNVKESLNKLCCRFGYCKSTNIFRQKKKLLIAETLLVDSKGLLVGTVRRSSIYRIFNKEAYNVQQQLAKFFFDGGVDFVFNALYYDDTCKSILSKYEQYIAIKDDKVFLCWEKDNGVLDFELIDKGVMLDDK